MAAWRVTTELHRTVEITVVTLSGRADRTSLLALVVELDSLAKRRAGTLRLLMDEAALHAGLVTPAEVRSIVAAWSDASALPEARIAVYAPSTMVYGLNSLVRAFSDRAERHIRVFRQRNEAVAWLCTTA